MKKLLIISLLSFSSFSHAGIDFDGYCKKLNGSVKNGKISSLMVVTNSYNDGEKPVLTANIKFAPKTGDAYHYGIMYNASTLYDIAKVSFLTQADIVICVGSEKKIPGKDSLYMIGLSKH
ncbi:Uncharacterised protein [Proteus vulgaris]|jgi:hypothetical protein|uniref:Uncharacterized protein n=1 Tax=Proteus vulgaris TaxID=585 RepID=A0A379FAN6_PROVU|nr:MULTISPECIES: hypothetical protein [Proteus]RNT24155.1 hypothetical protein B9475_015575 [Proteus mirabilis]AYY81908.1 hypothetical protein EGX81_13940 [Proteus vulgaris]KGA57393.1 hypothetical protein DR95_2402 [Proteus vulgaris]MBG5970882.1 hypothetical protein [Proteus vulgaris]MBI6512845.1 hypothetical protein [Proteus sp. PR00174]